MALLSVQSGGQSGQPPPISGYGPGAATDTVGARPMQHRVEACELWGKPGLTSPLLPCGLGQAMCLLCEVDSSSAQTLGCHEPG